MTNDEPPATPRSTDCYAVLPVQTRLVAFLMEVGWDLHLNSNREHPPILIKTTTAVVNTSFKTQEITIDDVLALQSAGLISKRAEYQADMYNVSIFRIVSA